MKHISTYLKRLKFDPKLLNSFIAKYITNLRLIILIVLGIAVFGIFSYSGLSRDLYPDVKIPMVFVTTVMPGANPKDVEALVTIPIEDSINSVSESNEVDNINEPEISEVIKLNEDANSQDIKSENSFGNLYSNWAMISLGVFSVVIALLLLLKNKKRKNELI